MPPTPDFGLGLYAATAAVLFMASALQGLTGFGFGTLSMAVLPFLMSAGYASVFVSLLSLFNVGYLAWHYRRHVDRRVLGGLVLGSVIGVPLGVHGLRVWPEAALRQAIGSAILIYCVYFVWETLGAFARRRLPGWVSVPVGVLAGGLSGAVNSGGPLAVFYLYQRLTDRLVILGTLSIYFWMLTAGKAVLLFSTGMVPLSVVGYGAAIPLIFLGSFLGARVGRRLRPEPFRLIVAGSLVLLGLLLLFNP